MSNQENQASAVLKGIVIGSSIPIILAVVFITYELIAPANMSIMAKMGEKIGVMQREMISASAPSEAVQELMIAYGQQEEARRTIRETQLQEAKKIQVATDMQIEQQAMAAQTSLLASSMAGKSLMVNLADMGCQLSFLWPDEELPQKACVMAKGQRQMMAAELKRSLENNRISMQDAKRLLTEGDFSQHGLTLPQMMEILEAINNEQ